MSYWQAFLLRLKGYRTVIINSITGLLAVGVWVIPDLLDLLNSTPMAPLLPERWAPWATLILAITNLYLRKITDTPIFKKEPTDGTSG